MYPRLLHTFVFSLLVYTGKGDKERQFTDKNINNFLRVQEASLSPTEVMKTAVNTSPENCATTCLSTETCKSFEISTKSPHTCHMYKEDTSEKRMTKNTEYDFYQVRTSNCPIDIVYGGSLYSRNDLGTTRLTSAECLKACHNNNCKSIDISFRDKYCYMSSYSKLPLVIDKDGWNYVDVNRDLLGEFLQMSSSDYPIRNDCNIKTLEDISSFYKKPVDSESAYFDLEYNPYVSIEMLLNIPIQSQVECSIECLRNDDCIAFNYHSGEQKTCQLKRHIKITKK